ncbi:hypothetical protein E2C01_036945 [Portunus trituberculatus]|uniref:Condensation domain-containing protein n=1 Tax=Portunus trituberculatus TaxID=210409 RepID=A0A5B7F810_PORTR|nr:hypothetical protein [Portunus trituberculatus]
MIAQVHHQVFSQTCILTLNTVTPITHELMEDALTILYKKVESLRICFRHHDNQMWVADMPQPVLDFKSVSGTDVKAEEINLTNSPFDLHNGPLWKARLMTSPENAPCRFPEIKADFPYQYELLLSLHHAANDGVVVMLVVELLQNIIDHLLQGLPVDLRPVGQLRDAIESRELEDRFIAALQNDPARFAAMLREHEESKHVPLLIEAYGSPSEPVEPMTYVFPPVLLEKDVVNRINHKCRLLGVTLNSFFTAVKNTAMVELARDGGLKRNNYSITSCHPVNSRRLMEKCSKPYLGFHGISLTMHMITPHNVKDHFWEYTKHFDTKFRKKIKGNWMIEDRAMARLLRPESYSHEEHFARPLPLISDYIFSNLYNPGNTTQGIGKFVQITGVHNQSTLHKASFPFGYALFGFRGQVRLEVGYATGTVRKEVTGRLLDKILAVISDVSNAPI